MEGRLYRKAKLKPLLVYSSELDLNDLWKLDSAVVRERNPATGGHTGLSSDPEKLPSIREMEPPSSGGWHFGLGCARPYSSGKERKWAKAKLFPSPQFSDGLKLEVLLLSEEYYYWWLFVGEAGCQTILLRVFWRGSKGWEDNDIWCPRPALARLTTLREEAVR